MPDQQRRSWHQPDVTNLPPDSYTSQKLVCTATDLTCHTLRRAGTCDARASASYLETLLHRAYPSMPSPFLDEALAHIQVDSMAYQTPTRLVQAPPPNQLLDAYGDLLFRSTRGPPTTAERP